MTCRKLLPVLAAVLTLILTSGISTSDLWAGGPPPVVPGELLGSTGAIGASLISIDPATGAGATRFPLGALGPVTDIRYSPDGTLYGSTGGRTSNFIIIDPDTGAETLVGNHGSGALTALEFADGLLYGALFGAAPPPTLGRGTDLVVIDPADGSLTTVGSIFGYSPVRGLAYDPSTGTMYGVGSPIPAAGEGSRGASDELFMVDLATAATTMIGPTSGFGIGGMTFGPDGLLYGGSIGPPAVEGQEQSLGGPGAPLVILDPATGTATVVGDTGSPALSGLAFVPVAGGGGGERILAIPTASVMGLLLLGALMAAAAVFVLRRG